MAGRGRPAKKKVVAKAKPVQETVQVVQTEVMEAPIVEVPIIKAPEVQKEIIVKKPIWEVKDRFYYLKGDKEPVSYKLKGKYLLFDEDLQYEREVKITKNQNTIFVDEFKGVVIPDHVVIRDGTLHLPKNKTLMQKFLSKHPQLGKAFLERDDEKVAVNELEDINSQLDAMLLAREIDIDVASAIVRTSVGSAVSGMTSKEIRRDALVLAKKDPSNFISLANDSNVEIRDKGVRAVEQNVIKIMEDGRTMIWVQTDRVMFKAPFGENPYNSLAAFLRTDEGFDYLSYIEKKVI